MHIPVMLTETMEVLCPKAGGRYLDVTLGGAGHAEAILEASAPDGRLLGTDADAAAVERCADRLERFGERARARQAWIDEAPAVARALGFAPVDGVVADLGLSSFQLGDAERGFAFMKEGPLDMRFDRSRGMTVAEWLEQADVEMLTRVLRTYGDVERARAVAEAIWAARPVRTTTELRDAVTDAAKLRPGKHIHPATQVFQALRIATNGELDRLERALPSLIGVLAPGGRLAVITFHSLEDRIVKTAFKVAGSAVEVAPGFGMNQAERPAWVRVLTKKPMLPGAAEVQSNPRARSAKLRAVERL